MDRVHHEATCSALEPPSHRFTDRIRLSDGRWLYLYGDKRTSGVVVRDGRGLSPLAFSSTLRRDPASDEWVIMAPHRASRTTAQSDGCALCPSTDMLPTEIPVADYDVAVFENRFPALGGTTESGTPDGCGEAEGSMFETAPAAGSCEVVSFSSRHNTSLARLPLSSLRTVIDVWADRTRALNRLSQVQQVVCFENRGAGAGATQSHPHGQIYAYPFVPQRFQLMWDAARRSCGKGLTCLFCRLVAAEELGGQRLVLRTSHWTAFVPFASRWPCEVHLYARRHVPDLQALDEAEAHDLAHALRRVLRCFESVTQEPLPYMAVWIQAPAQSGRDLAHLSLQIFSDRSPGGGIKRPAAGELGAGAFVSEADPEGLARALRALVRE
ncbi:galactose-1-phosphate uridylyltransferase [Streptomyces sp. NBC_00715]|uniref:galactose-1-phosphate uridylyltransferase n=1 Tax=Streptomyces sp. NBC_00715 TaxID=2975811 RepID=UPI002F90F204